MATVDDVDVQMKDMDMEENKDSKSGSDSKESSNEKNPYDRLVENLSLLVRAGAKKDPRIVRKVLRRTTEIRSKLPLSTLRQAVDEFLPPESVNKSLLLATVDKMVASDPAPMDQEEKKDAEKGKDAPASLKPTSCPEVEIYLHLLVAAAALKRAAAHAADAASVSSVLVDRLLNIEPRHTLDYLGARAYQYYSTAHEISNSLESIRSVLLVAYRTACLRHDDMGQATLINLLLRNYLHYNLYDQALLFVEYSSDFPATVSNNQFVRHLYYRGLIQAMQLEYTDAHQKLVQALRKAPQGKQANGFRLTVQRLAVVVQLLMAEVPERSVFNHPDLRNALKPYLMLTQAVRQGEIGAFQNTLEQFRGEFSRDRTLSLVLRLRHSVIKTGLRNISLSYSKISFADVAQKLNLDSAEDAEHVCAKAIMDGVIDAALDHDQGFLRSRETGNSYSTTQPEQAFNARIEFCLEVRNDAVKGMRYPPNEHKEKLDKVKEDAKSREEDMNDMKENGVEDDSEDEEMDAP